MAFPGGGKPFDPQSPKVQTYERIKGLIDNWRSDPNRPPTMENFDRLKQGIRDSGWSMTERNSPERRMIDQLANAAKETIPDTAYRNTMEAYAKSTQDLNDLTKGLTVRGGSTSSQIRKILKDQKDGGDLINRLAKYDPDLPYKIAGLDVWTIISRQSGAKNPHESYWFYHESNKSRTDELEAVTTSDGQWKLQLPHTYQTLAGKPGGKDGVPAAYSHRKIEHEELYDLVHDIGETTDVSAQHPDIVKQLEAEAEKARVDLGDALTKRPGEGWREPGRLNTKN
jgi:hypothetical protein